ncbi:ribonuclease H-like domain-containing protein [Paeniclostridium hominis]|uniref:ribonuclease H-like domain-containing protein n=1 Tax=Paeniclostridium hominis TaxID=2764329 RepID=UPI0022E3DE41|nr:ribonuclease H-like domain-containing protein [Paeniclostridium hominis]
MQVITKTLDDLIDIPENHFVFDIETTGLSPKFSKVILIGILYNHKNKTIIKQYFASSEEKEKDILLTFIEDIKNFKGHVTFNGISFDIPFLNSRFEKHKIDYNMDKSKDIDILRLIKPYKEKLSLSDCKLKTIEKYLGIEREDTISGKESVKLYKEFVLTKDKLLKKKILLHNYEDIFYLGKIFKIRDVLHEKLDYINISINEIVYKILLTKYKISKSTLNLTFISNNKFNLSINLFSEDYSIVSDEYNLYLNINLHTAIDSNYSKILFYNLGSIIPIKINDKFITENILALSKYIFSKEFNYIN